MAEDRRKRRREATRAEIVAAAWRLAERDGLGGLALRDLAAEVGMRAPSLYTYFDGKDAIYDAMYVDGYAAFDDLLADSAPTVEATATSDPTAAIIDATTRFLRFCQASIPRYQLLFTRVIPGWQPSPDAYAIAVRSYERMASALAAAGIVGQDALDLYSALTSGLAAQQLANDPDGDRWIRLVPDAVHLFLSHRTTGDRS